MNFSQVAPYLGNPLVLIGFGLFLFFGTHRVLVRSGVIPQLRQRDAPPIVLAVLRYGFVIAVLLIIAGVTLAGWKAYIAGKERRELTRLDAESLLQKERGSIERCLGQNDKISFLNFFFSQAVGGGLGVDVLAGHDLFRVPFWHSRLPHGIYHWSDLEKLLAARDLPHDPPPADVDTSKRLYFIPGNEETEDPHEYHAVVTVAEVGTKLSMTDPDKNLCIVGLLIDPLRAYNALPNNRPFMHRYITDHGVSMSTPRRGLG